MDNTRSFLGGLLGIVGIGFSGFMGERDEVELKRLNICLHKFAVLAAEEQVFCNCDAIYLLH
jgi:hypothetical protein